VFNPGDNVTNLKETVSIFPCPVLLWVRAAQKEAFSFVFDIQVCFGMCGSMNRLSENTLKLVIPSLPCFFCLPVQFVKLTRTYYKMTFLCITVLLVVFIKERKKDYVYRFNSVFLLQEDSYLFSN
jgi:hypothetical protein